MEKDVTLIRKTILMHLESLWAFPATDNKIHIYGLSSYVTFQIEWPKYFLFIYHPYILYHTKPYEPWFCFYIVINTKLLSQEAIQPWQTIDRRLQITYAILYLYTKQIKDVIEPSVKFFPHYVHFFMTVDILIHTNFFMESSTIFSIRLECSYIIVVSLTWWSWRITITSIALILIILTLVIFVGNVAILVRIIGINRLHWTW